MAQQGSTEQIDVDQLTTEQASTELSRLAELLRKRLRCFATKPWTTPKK